MIMVTHGHRCTFGQNPIACLIGVNPELGDRVPLRLMRENDLDTVAPEIMGAARAFLVGG